MNRAFNVILGLVYLNTILAQDLDSVELLIYIGTPGTHSPSNSSIMGDEFRKQYAHLFQNGFGTLQPNGMRQMYNLGLSLRKDYPKLLGEGLDPRQYESYSDSTLLASLSASSFYAALNKSSNQLEIDRTDYDKLYPFTRDRSKQQQLEAAIKFDSGLPPNMEVISIRHSEDEEERFAKGFRAVCPTFDNLYRFASRTGFEELGKNVFNITEELNFLKNNLPLRLSDSTIQKLPLAQAAYVLDPLHSIEFSSPEGLSAPLKRSYEYFLKIFGFVSVAQYSDRWEDYYKWIASPILQEVSSLFTSAAKESNTKSRVLTSYIGDHLTFNSIIQALQGFNRSCFEKVAESSNGDVKSCGPRALVTSNYILELVKSDTQYFVNTRFEGEYVDVCKSEEVLKNSKFSCPLKVWTKKITEGIYPEWKEKCIKQNSNEDNQQAMIGVVILLLGIFFFLAVAVLIALALFFKKSPHDEEIGDSAEDNKKTKDLNHSSSNEDFSMDPDARDHAFVRVKRN